MKYIFNCSLDCTSGLDWVSSQTTLRTRCVCSTFSLKELALLVHLVQGEFNQLWQLIQGPVLCFQVFKVFHFLLFDSDPCFYQCCWWDSCGPGDFICWWRSKGKFELPSHMHLQIVLCGFDQSSFLVYHCLSFKVSRKAKWFGDGSKLFLDQNFEVFSKNQCVEYFNNCLTFLK